MDSIFVGGKPLKEFLNSVVENEIINEFNSVVSRLSRIKRKHVFKVKYEGIKCGHSKVRILSDNEIRKEMGIVNKPYKSVLKNVLALLNEKGPLKVSDMMKAFPNYTREGFSWALLNFRQKCPDLMTKGGYPACYVLLADPDQAYDEYRSKVGKKDKVESSFTNLGTCSKIELVVSGCIEVTVRMVGGV